jgi:hypothetical protein
MLARLHYVPGVPFGQLSQHCSLWLVSETNVRTQQSCNERKDMPRTRAPTRAAEHLLLRAMLG